MELIAFETFVVARCSTGELLVALMDGGGEEHECVALVTCKAPVGIALREAIGSALKE